MVGTKQQPGPQFRQSTSTLHFTPSPLTLTHYDQQTHKWIKIVGVSANDDFILQKSTDTVKGNGGRTFAIAHEMSIDRHTLAYKATLKIDISTTQGGEQKEVDTLTSVDSGTCTIIPRPETPDNQP